ncbi:MAG: dodecin domain-containing protein [Clostridia bacterium]|nr:dodecin domain-containing protein [Clostridia bacterium]
MDIEKHLIITGTSDVSWKDAIVKTINEASKSIDYLSSVKILEQRAKIDGNKISEYFVDLDLTFLIDLNRKDDN